MNQSLIVLISEGTLFVFVALAFLLLIAASVYDAVLISRRQQLKALMRRLRRPRQPWVTVLLYADNNAASIEASLDSLRKSYYHHYDVVVINNASTDHTKQVLKSYLQKHTRVAFRIFQKRKKTAKLTALREGYRLSQKGELVLVMNANSKVERDFIKAGVARFVANEKLSALEARQCYLTPFEFTSLAAQFWQLSYLFYKKSLSLARITRVRVGTSTVIYRAPVFKKARSVKCLYDASLMVRIQSAPPVFENHEAAATMIARAIAALGLILLMSYFIVIAARLESSSMLTLSWLALSLWGIVTIWSDETKTLTKKLALVVTAPLLYFLLYVQLILWIFGFMRDFSHTSKRFSVYA